MSRRRATIEEANAAREAERMDPNARATGWHRRATQPKRVYTKIPTVYEYEVPQVKSQKCTLCRIDENDDVATNFLGHNEANDDLRHLLCLDHYSTWRRGNSTRGAEFVSCPTCRRDLGEWDQRNPKVVRIAADGTETVVSPGMVGGGAGRRKNRKRTHKQAHSRRHTRRVITRRRR